VFDPLPDLVVPIGARLVPAAPARARRFLTRVELYGRSEASFTCRNWPTRVNRCRGFQTVMPVNLVGLSRGPGSESVRGGRWFPLPIKPETIAAPKLLYKD
jgi:hypothetical protein